MVLVLRIILLLILTLLAVSSPEYAMDKPSEKANRDLLAAARGGSVPEALKALGDGAQIEVRDTDENERWTPLHAAGHSGCVELVRILLDRNADTSAPALRGASPLAVVCRVGHTEVARLLIERQANVNARDVARYTPLHTASFNGFIELVKLLLDKGADINAQNEIGINAIASAASQGHVEMVRELCRRGCLVDTTYQNGQITPIHSAYCAGHRYVVRVMLAYGTTMSPFMKENLGSQNSLIVLDDVEKAIVLGSMGVLQKLMRPLEELDKTARPSAMQLSQWLLMATAQRQINIVSFLLQRGADPAEALGRLKIIMGRELSPEYQTIYAIIQGLMESHQYNAINADLEVRIPSSQTMHANNPLPHDERPHQHATAYPQLPVVVVPHAQDPYQRDFLPVMPQQTQPPVPKRGPGRWGP